jgi:mono/diheme cytochrome c family protein
MSAMPEETICTRSADPDIAAIPEAGESGPGASPNAWIVRLGLAGLAVCLLSGGLFYYTSRGLLGRSGAAGSSGAPVDPMRNVVSLEHGLAVYSTNCASCHGATGMGDGPQAEALAPRPRNFASGAFKIGSTRSGLPTDTDLAMTIRHGMQPAAMPPWGHLTEGEVKSLAMAVRHLAVEGRVEDKLKRTPGFDRAKALELARAALEPGAVIALPAKPVSLDPERGRAFYTNNCAVCHDPDGRGRLREDLVDNDEQPIAARDFTAGVFKGGDSLDDIAMRIVRGIPGSPMPANPAISTEDLWSTAAYVKGFSATTAKKPAPGSSAVGE